MDKQHRLPRRRPGGVWELWSVHGQDRQSGADRHVGYLVTTGNGFPRPVAFIRGSGQAALELAVRVRADHEVAGASTGDVMDLRATPSSKLPPCVVGMALYPVDSIGRRITTDRTFEGGIYVRQMGRGKGPGFYLCTHGNMPPHFGQPPEQKSGSPLPHDAPQLGGGKGVGAGLVTAA
jgi:hypothetical protein